jgi:hypothetical protein
MAAAQAFFKEKENEDMVRIAKRIALLYYDCK